ncbi:hypothetical protein HYI36_08415 [Bacillus sp. Gen3]|nr:hypothetical protein [Bacillus sp. Gen3]
MNHYVVQIMAGQIKFVQDFFKDYKDEKIKTSLKSVERIRAVLNVVSDLPQEEMIKHIKNTFKHSPIGSALHFTVQIVE